MHMVLKSLGLVASLSAFCFCVTYLSAMLASALVGGPILAFLDVAMVIQACLSFSGGLLRFFNEMTRPNNSVENLSFWRAFWFGCFFSMKGMIFDAFRAEQGLFISYFFFLEVFPIGSMLLIETLSPALPLFLVGMSYVIAVVLFLIALCAFIENFGARAAGILRENNQRTLAGQPRWGFLTGLWAGWRSFLRSYVPVYFGFLRYTLTAVPRYASAFFGGQLYETLREDWFALRCFFYEIGLEARRVRLNPLDRPEEEHLSSDWAGQPPEDGSPAASQSVVGSDDESSVEDHRNLPLFNAVCQSSVASGLDRPHHPHSSVALVPDFDAKAAILEEDKVLDDSKKSSTSARHLFPF